MPDNIGYLGEWVFYQCKSLKEMTINSKDITIISKGTFQECTSLKNIILPENIHNIGKQAFYKCTSLEKINIPGHVEKIGEWAFADCTSIGSLTIPESIVSILDHAFANMTEKQKILIKRTSLAKNDWDFFWNFDCKANITWEI